MTTLTNFNNFELNTNETNNVIGGCGSRRRRSSGCSKSYSKCCNSSCETVEETIIEETIVEATPVIATPEVIETPESLDTLRGGVAGL